MKTASHCILAALALSLGLSACGDDEKEGTGGDGKESHSSYATSVSDFCKKYVGDCEGMTVSQCEESIAFYGDTQCQNAYATYVNCVYSVLGLDYCTNMDVLENMTEEQVFTAGMKCLNDSQSYLSACGYN